MGSARAVLRAVESEFFREEVQFSQAAGDQDSHSLHYSLNLPESMRPEVAAHFIARYSKRGEVVLDPFCGCGATALEANLQGRIAFAGDVSPLAVKVARAKVEPADITEVTLRLQQINFRRPISTSLFAKAFEPFFDLETFRELMNLRSFIQQNYDRTSRFVELAALSLLHGPSAGYFSVYSFPQVSLSPSEQSALNLKRGQVPDYRAVGPRILRKVASGLRDGIPSVLRQLEFRNRFFSSDARNLSSIPSASVDLVVTSAPSPDIRDYLSALWMKLWFAGLGSAQQIQVPEVGRTVQSWLDFMNQAVLELARVLKVGARAAIELRQITLHGQEVNLEQELLRAVQRDLGRYFEGECVVFERMRGTAVGSCLRDRDPKRQRERSRVLVLRRR